MNDDLISRSAVMDYLRGRQANVIIEKNKCGFVSTDVCNGMQSAIDAFMNFIVQIPIAYDVGKVVEQLESRKTYLLKNLFLRIKINLLKKRLLIELTK